MRTLPVLLAGTRTLPDLATFNAATLDRLAATGDLYVTGAALPRDLLSDNRALAAARLRNTWWRRRRRSSIPPETPTARFSSHRAGTSTRTRPNPPAAAAETHPAG